MGSAADLVEFGLIAEAGALERQALLLCESIRLFGGRLAGAPITAVSPRPSRRPHAATLAALERLQVDYLPLDIDTPCPEYGTSFRIHGLAHIEHRRGPPILVQLDSDTLFVAEPVALTHVRTAAGRPVDAKGMCTSGAGDLFDAYWRDLCALLGVDYAQMPMVETTVDRKRVLANYNGGLLAVRRDLGIFARTEDFFIRLAQARLQPWAGTGLKIRSSTGMVSERGSAFWGTSQAAFSLACVQGGHAVDILPPGYNLPLHAFGPATPAPLPLIHLHYHWLAHEERDSGTLLDERLGLSEAVREWLLRRLPLDARMAA